MVQNDQQETESWRAYFDSVQLNVTTDFGTVYVTQKQLDDMRWCLEDPEAEYPDLREARTYGGPRTPEPHAQHHLLQTRGT